VGFLRKASAERPSIDLDPDVSALDQMRRAGADPGVPHVTRHFFYVPGVRPAQQLARSLKAHGRQVEIDTSARKGYWLVVVSQSMLVTPESIADTRSEFENAARPVGGRYDRWQVEIAGG
jgi:hypothetical protein